MEPVAVALMVLIVWVVPRIFADWLSRIIFGGCTLVVPVVLAAASPKALVSLTVGAWLSLVLFVASKVLKLIAALKNRDGLKQEGPN